MTTIMQDTTAYLQQALTGIKPVLAFMFAAASFLFFPTGAFLTSAIAVGIAVLLDIVTKFVALSAKNGGYLKAVKAGAISSDRLWKGSRIKIFAYLVVAILAGLAYRVVQLDAVGVFFGTVVYSVLFLREAQSIVENLCDAGADLKWLALWTKRKEEQILNNKEEKK
jgi:hypothetical protein